MRLLDTVRRACRVRRLAYATEQAYVHWTRRLVHVQHARHGAFVHPDNLGDADMAAFLHRPATARL